MMMLVVNSFLQIVIEENVTRHDFGLKLYDSNLSEINTINKII